MGIATSPNVLSQECQVLRKNSFPENLSFILVPYSSCLEVTLGSFDVVIVLNSDVLLSYAPDLGEIGGLLPNGASFNFLLFEALPVEQVEGVNPLHGGEQPSQ